MESEQTLLSAISQITALDAGAMDAARKRQAELAKPPGSLGLLEDISVQLAGITGSVKNTIQKTRIYVLAADNGVVDEGVSSAPQSVTLAQSINLTRGLTGASCLAKHFGDELVVVDGFISIVAALCAGRLAPLSKGYFLGSHRSFEVGFRLAERELGLKPCLDLGMRLGEGSGCPIAFRVVEAACAVMDTMATFPEAAIDDTYLTEIRAKDSFTV